MMPFRLLQHPFLYSSGLIALLLVVSSPVKAFPPAPSYTLYGIVRDQVGQVITAEGAEIILFKGNQILARALINNGARLDQNYSLHLRLDQNRTGTTIYDERAVGTEGLFSIAVDIAGVRYYPIEASGSLTAGKGGERVRLDLNLGEDTDKDGLPDAWEQWQLYQAGHLLGADGKWQIQLIDRNGDFDQDGLTNGQEYVAGTFAGDATERFELKIEEETPAQIRFSFYAIIGKTYTIEKTTDFVTWTRIPFSVGSPTTGSDSWTADGVGVVTAYSLPENSSKRFYRLTVR